MTEVFVGDDLLELAKAKELASVMGGAWHANEEDWDADSDSEQGSPVPSSSSQVSSMRFLSCTRVEFLDCPMVKVPRRQRRRSRDARPRSNAKKVCTVR